MMMILLHDWAQCTWATIRGWLMHWRAYLWAWIKPVPPYWELALLRSHSNGQLASPSEVGFQHHRASHSPIRRRLQASALNPFGPMDPPPQFSLSESRTGPGNLGTTSTNGRGWLNPFARAALRSDIAFLRQQSATRQSHRRKKTLVLDLDETLVHASVVGGADCDLITEVFLNGRSCLYYVKKRPHLDLFLETVAAWYRLAIFTASVHQYADAVVSWLDRGRRLFSHRLFRHVYNPTRDHMPSAPYYGGCM
jgi:hypothetical protein